MSGLKYLTKAKRAAASLPILLAASIPVATSAEATPPITAGYVMSDMPVGERTAYIRGVVEGLAYARFRKDSLTKGERDETGMICVLTWFGKEGLATLLHVEATFKKYATEYPPLLLALMIKKECGE